MEPLRLTDLRRYEECLSKFRANCEELGAAVVSVILYGSLARGDIRPGRSDVLDAAVVLNDEVLEDQAMFERVMRGLLAACKDVRESGLPYHPFLYFTLNEILTRHRIYNLTAWKSQRTSTVLLGRDIRSEARSSDSDRRFARGAFFASQQVVYRLARYLAARDDSPEARASVLKGIKWFIQTIPKLACIACGAEVEYPLSIEQLRTLLPGHDVARFEALDRWRRDPNNETDPDAALVILREIVALNALLYDAVVRRLTTSGDWADFSDWIKQRPAESAER